ncbi:MAG: IscS subfamily cysteine desulfurase [Syntrophobacteraceae bacterium]|nr:IscS subfamily cysteine desulfurase [Syntrophobacteraceae bacterium]
MQLQKNERRALCGICPAGCWVIVTCGADGKMSSVRADEGSPLGIVCKLGQHSAEIVYSENRLQYPLRRKGPKGTYDFERISWEEAFQTIAGKLTTIKDRHGPEATAIYTGRGSFELALCDVFQPKDVAVSSASSVLFPLGSPNTMGVGALCYVSFAMIAPHVTMGGMLINMFSEIENSELIVVWGANPATDSPPLELNRILEAVGRGAKVVVIDPRRTQTARLTEAEWVPIRPGTDGALALGLSQVLIEEELYDEPFVKQWTLGFPEFARYVQHFRPEVVESITGVPRETVRSLARRIAGARGASPVMYSGLEYSDSGVQAIRATLVLWALAGQLDMPGGRCFTMKQNIFPINREGHIPNPNPKKALGVERFPVYSAYRGESHASCLPDSVLQGKPYRIRSLMILGASMITAWPRPEVWRKTLGALDFLVCIDVNLTADCAYADIVLPAATSYEIDSYMTYGPLFRLREKVIEPVGEARNSFFILTELAERLGYGHLYPRTEEELLRHVLKGSPFTLEEVRAAGGQVQLDTVMMEYRKWEKGLLRADGQPGFETPTGKFEISSTILEEHGYDPLPVYTEPAESPLSRPELAGEFPLVFNSGSRVTTDFRSQFHGVVGLAKERPEPTVTINTRDASARNIGQGDRVILRSPRGSVRLRALVSDDIVQGAVDANMGGGGPLGPRAWQECNINDLTDLKFDPISGFPIYKALLCEVERAKEPGQAIEIDSGESGVVTFKATQAGVEALESIYLDHNATTHPDPEVRALMDDYLESRYGNPSAIYREGREAKAAIEEARKKVARLLGCTARRIVFTGGGSEANNQVIKSLALADWNGKKRLITSSIEHPSILKVCDWLEKYGFNVTCLQVDSYGRVSPEDLEKAITEDTFLVSIMAANNETGSLQPIAELAGIAQRRGVLFHTDAVQAAGKVPLDVETLGVDFLTLSGHKFHGPKGVGALYIRKGIELEPLLHGGGQEGGLRAGTENTAGIAGVGKAAELAEERIPDMNQRVRLLRDRLWEGIRRLIPEAKLNGHPEYRLPNTLNVSLPGIRGEAMVLALDRKSVFLSSGSACRAGSPKPSHALLNMGLSEEEAHCALRISLGAGTTETQIDQTLARMEEVIRESMTTVRFVPCR